jgi:2-polyprenyl-3-methyl-5-hydroxy-6-metoxy-1,4-benzoquinol methylase
LPARDTLLGAAIPTEEGMNPNQGQVEAWNGGESVHYVDHSDRYDRQLAPFADALLERVGLAQHERVLDIGCGCGVTTLAAGRLARRAVGVDISSSLLEVATERARVASAGCHSRRPRCAGTFARP